MVGFETINSSINGFFCKAPFNSYSRKVLSYWVSTEQSFNQNKPALFRMDKVKILIAPPAGNHQEYSLSKVFRMIYKILQRGLFSTKTRSQIVQFFSEVPLLSTFLGVAALMTIFEVVKELFFQGELTLWESHIITVFVTATFSTIDAYFICLQADKLTTKAQAAHRKAAGIIQNIFDAVVIIDDKGTIKTFNPAAEKIFGYKEEEVKGSTSRF